MEVLSAFLIAETSITSNGEGPPLEIGKRAGLVLLTLGILEVVEQESLLIGIEGSTDAQTWTQLIDFPQRFYTGVCAVLVNPGECCYLRAKWKTARWGRADHTPFFRLYLFAESFER